MNKEKVLELRKKIIEKNFRNLNEMQFRAVTTTEGPLLILAGAGSGKTTVLINRIAGMIKYGNAYNSDKVYSGFEDNPEELMQAYLDGDRSVWPDIAGIMSVDAPKPWQILAITFTNKAANELKDRLSAALGEDDGNEVWASTFHSCCVRILRRYADRIGYSTHFTIYDSDDSKRVIKECERQLSIDEKTLPPKTVLTAISNAKDGLVSPEEYLALNQANARAREIASVYDLYTRTLKKADAMDFDDIIINTVALLQNDKEVLEYYRNRFRYIMVDEYQDTNHAQYVLVSLLAGGHNNICVVGDDDQSIYSFRGATIENILSFEEQFGNAKVIKLEENYRSTSTILNAANAVITHNMQRKGKNLHTNNGEGDKITLKVCDDERSEAYFVADTIMQSSLTGAFSDNAVLYRTNAQSNNIERALAGNGIPYVIVGGHRFYDRKEIKDAIAYLSVVSNPNDDVRLRRIINEPKRGIGDTTINNVASIAGVLGKSMFEIMCHADEYAQLSRSREKLMAFAKMINGFVGLNETETPSGILRTVLMDSGYISGLATDPETAKDRAQNLDEFYNTVVHYEETNGDDTTLEGFLEEVALISDLDSLDDTTDKVTLMTLHSAKGLEYPNVFLVGMEEGLFPSSQSETDENKLEEERRLAYVGITRAKKKLYILRAKYRMQFGKTSSNPPSRFIDEIPGSLVDDISPERNKSSNSSGYGYGSYTGASGRNYGSYNRGSSYGSSSYGSSSFGESDYGFDDYNRASTKRQTGDYGFSKEKKATKPIASGSFKAGDRVSHKKFGEGMVLSVTPLGGDFLVEVAFDKSGTKKLMQAHAGLSKI